MIEYKGKQYETRDIELPEIGWVLVSTIELGDAAFGEGDWEDDKEARYIDEQIYYYCTPDEMKLSDSELLELLKGTL